MGIKTKCPHCGQEHNIRLTYTKTAYDTPSQTIKATIGHIKGPIYATSIVILILIFHIVFM